MRLSFSTRLYSKIVLSACRNDEGVSPPYPVLQALYDTCKELMAAEFFWFPDLEDDFDKWTGLEESIQLRQFLERKEKLLSHEKEFFEIGCQKIITLFSALLGLLPENMLDTDYSTNNTESLSFSVDLIDIIDRPVAAIEGATATFFDKDVYDADLFYDLREQLEHNLYVASGLRPGSKDVSEKQVMFPSKVRGKTLSELTEIYLKGTPLFDLFLSGVPLSISEETRFEHCHVLGGTGHGKTQLLQKLIHHDLLSAIEDGRSVVIIDSQGDLIRTISHLALFGDELADRLLLIDPNDVEFPIALNMFDIDRDRINSYSRADQERILNGVVELYEYVFSALLGAELTQKQGVIFRYLARLMLVIPGATIQTLRELMEDGKPFKPYMDNLDGSARRFFETEFFSRSFNATKSQILKRLWGVLANPVFERMFSYTENKIDLFEAMNNGKIILINTAKDLLKQEGCEIFGRFFIAKISQAAMERSAIPEEKRCPTFVYIDEAQDYFDSSIDHLLSQRTEISCWVDSRSPES